MMIKLHENSQGVATLHIHCLLEESCIVQNVIGGCSRTGFDIACKNALKFYFHFVSKIEEEKITSKYALLSLFSFKHQIISISVLLKGFTIEVESEIVLTNLHHM